MPSGPVLMFPQGVLAVLIFAGGMGLGGGVKIPQITPHCNWQDSFSSVFQRDNIQALHLLCTVGTEDPWEGPAEIQVELGQLTAWSAWLLPWQCRASLNAGRSHVVADHLVPCLL